MNRKLLAFMSHLLATGFSIVLLYTFIIAVINGGQVTISINTYGEMWIETIVIPIAFAFMLYGLLFGYKIKRR